MKGTFGRLNSSQQQAPAVAYSRIAAQYRTAFLRLFAPQVAAEVDEALVAGVAERTLGTLYAGLNYADFEAGIFEFVRAAQSALPVLVNNWSYSFLGNAFTKENAEAALGLFTTRVPEFSKTGSRTQLWLAKNFDAAESGNLLQLEPMLCSLYWAFENPAKFEVKRQQFLLIGLNTMWESLPDGEKAKFRAAGWLIPTTVGTRALMAGDMGRVLTASPAIWTNLQVAV